MFCSRKVTSGVWALPPTGLFVNSALLTGNSSVVVSGFEIRRSNWTSAANMDSIHVSTSVHLVGGSMAIGLPSFFIPADLTSSEIYTAIIKPNASTGTRVIVANNSEAETTTKTKFQSSAQIVVVQSPNDSQFLQAQGIFALVPHVNNRTCKVPRNLSPHTTTQSSSQKVLSSVTRTVVPLKRSNSTLPRTLSVTQMKIITSPVVARSRTVSVSIVTFDPTTATQQLVTMRLSFTASTSPSRWTTTILPSTTLNVSQQSNRSTDAKRVARLKDSTAWKVQAVASAVAAGAALIGSVFRPGPSANKPGNLRRAVQLATCETIEKDTNADALFWFNYLPLFGGLQDVGERRLMKAQAGTTMAILLSSLALLLFYYTRVKGKAAEGTIQLFGVQQQTLLSGFSIAFLLAHSFYGPNSVELATPLIAGGSGLLKALSLCCVFVRYLCILPAAFILVKHFNPRTGTISTQPPYGSLELVIYPWYESAKEAALAKLAVRLLIFEDVLMADIFAFLAGLEDCRLAAMILIVFGILHFLYIAVVHPYSSRIETCICADTSSWAGLAKWCGNWNSPATTRHSIRSSGFDQHCFGKLGHVASHRVDRRCSARYVKAEKRERAIAGNGSNDQ